MLVSSYSSSGGLYARSRSYTMTSKRSPGVAGVRGHGDGKDQRPTVAASEQRPEVDRQNGSGYIFSERVRKADRGNGANPVAVSGATRPSLRPRDPGSGMGGSRMRVPRARSPAASLARAPSVRAASPRTYDPDETAVKVPLPRSTTAGSSPDKSRLASVGVTETSTKEGSHRQHPHPHPHPHPQHPQEERHRRTDSEQSIVEDVHATDSGDSAAFSYPDPDVRRSGSRTDHPPVPGSQTSDVRQKPKQSSGDSRRRNVRHQRAALAARCDLDEKNVRWRSPLVSPAPSTGSSRQV